MKHFKTIKDEDEVSNLMLHKIEGSQPEPKDELVISIEGTRLQQILNIEAVHTHKVHAGYCYLHLTGIDDLRGLFKRNLSQQN